jgi:hypothetical protein
VPSYERVRSHDDEERSPVGGPREHDECDSGGIVQVPRLDSPLDIERQLLAKEEVFSREAVVGGTGQRHEVEQITNEQERRADHPCHWRAHGQGRRAVNDSGRVGDGGSAPSYAGAPPA